VLCFVVGGRAGEALAGGAVRNSSLRRVYPAYDKVL